jgi:hypothetical protein
MEPTMLTGPELLAKVKELGDVSKSELVRSCGYVSTKKDGSEGSAPPSGVTQEVLCPFLEGEQEQSEDDCLEADCAAPFSHYEP